MTRPSYTTEFKRDTASLVLDQVYSTQQAVGASRTAVSRWVKQLEAKHTGYTPTTSPAMTPEQQQIQAL